MISMKFLLKYKYSLYSIAIWFISIFFDITYENFISNGITCISIIFAFSQTFIFAAYSHERINEYMKKHDMLENFIAANKRFLKESLLALLLLFLISVKIFSYKFSYIYISSNHIVLFVVVYQLSLTIEFLNKYMNFYKNSYSNRLKNEK